MENLKEMFLKILCRCRSVDCDKMCIIKNCYCIILLRYMSVIREATKYTRPFSTWSHPNFPTISLNLCGKKTLAALRDFLHLFRPAYILPCKRQAAWQI
jgi:hypothetical protein